MIHHALRLPVAAFALASASCIAMAPAHAQGTQEQQDACAPDAFKLCQNTIPDIPKTEACMRAHFAQLSPRCQQVFNDVTRGSSKRPSGDVARGEAAAPPPVAPAPRGGDDMAFPLDPTTGSNGREASATARAPGSSTGPLASYTDQIRSECREGLIDPFTCRNTLAILRGSE